MSRMKFLAVYTCLKVSIVSFFSSVKDSEGEETLGAAIEIHITCAQQARVLVKIEGVNPEIPDLVLLRNFIIWYSQ